MVVTHIFVFAFSAFVAAYISSLLTGLRLKSQRKLSDIPQLYLERHFDALCFLLNGTKIIQDGYDKNCCLFVSSWDHIKDIDVAPGSQLSLQAAAKQLQPKYSMCNFNCFDKRGVEGTPLVPLLDQIIAERTLVNGAKHFPLYPMIVECIAYPNALAFFGEDLARNKEFMKAAKQFIERTLLIAEIMRLLPNWTASTVGKLVSRQFSSHETIHRTLIPVPEQRMTERDQQKQGHTVPTHNPWTAERIVHELVALWFGSAHILSTTICFAIHNLCLHQEYMEPLRRELESGQWGEFEKSDRDLLLLDSFLKESAHTCSVESMSSQRKLEAGQWIGTPLRAMLRAQMSKTNEIPLEFQGFRHVEPTVPDQAVGKVNGKGQPGQHSPPTDVNTWPLWGTGRMVCPGRFYAASAMKTFAALFITKYDMELLEQAQARWISWRTFIYLYPGTTLALRARRAE
ncbi:cytochrome P450 [Periconia macrospinosa]|uniref:Cytochrome P450 n=1 Tax=Periconia macrospinosa TaxID=97972 RepID=A0A2V1DPE8_9PLEO|nr:cytochrome P450 [Periconia macrospinosa]